MTLNVWQRNIVDEAGNVISEAEIEIFHAGESTKPIIYSDLSGSSLTNPFDATIAGFAQFYAIDGFYDIAVNGVVLWENQQLGSGVYDTPAQAALASLPVGAKYSTNGAVTIGDGGHGDFIVSATAPTTEDGYSCFEHANGTFGVLQPVNGCVDIHQFGIDPANMRFALERADDYCQATGIKLVGSGSAIMYGAATLGAPFIDLGSFTIKLGDSFEQTVAVIYSPVPSAIDSVAHISLRFDGNRDNQDHSICALRVNSCATPDQRFYTCGTNCGTLLDLNGNVERGEFHTKGVNTDCIVLESGSSPDTNRHFISGGNYKRAYWKSVSTTSQVTLNCQTQDLTSTDYAIEINGGRGTTIAGELRIVYKGFYLGGFTQQSIDYLHFNNFEMIAFIPPSTATAFNIGLCNHISGFVKYTAGGVNGQPFTFASVSSADLSVLMGDTSYVGNLVVFGDQANTLAASGKFTLTGRSIQASAVFAHFDRVGDISVSFYGSAIPITVASTVNNDQINLDLQPSYLSGNIAITTNGVRVNGFVRGMHSTATILAYTNPFRGMRCLNIATNGFVFYGGSDWQRYTTSTLV